MLISHQRLHALGFKKQQHSSAQQQWLMVMVMLMVVVMVVCRCQGKIPQNRSNSLVNNEMNKLLYCCGFAFLGPTVSKILLDWFQNRWHSLHNARRNNLSFVELIGRRPEDATTIWWYLRFDFIWGKYWEMMPPEHSMTTKQIIITTTTTTTAANGEVRSGSVYRLLENHSCSTIYPGFP